MFLAEAERTAPARRVTAQKVNFFIFLSSFVAAILEAQLQPREQHVFISPSDRRGRAGPRPPTSLKVGMRKARRETKIAVEPPIKSDRPTVYMVGGARRVRIERKGIIVNVQFSVTRHQLPRAPASIMEVEGVARNHRPIINRVLASEVPETRNLPGRVL